MKLEKAITLRILNLCQRKGISAYRLAVISDVPYSTIKSIFNGKSKNTGTRTILDLCEALEITLFDFFNDDMFKTFDIEGSE